MLTLRQHEIRAIWSVTRKRWVCQRCRRRLKFRTTGTAAHGNLPFHKWWWT